MSTDNEIFATNNLKQKSRKICHKTSSGNSSLVQAKGRFQEKLSAYNERRRVNPYFCRADFVYLIQELRSNYLRLRNRCANCLLVYAKGGFQERLYAHNESRKVNVKFCPADFACLI